MVKENLLEYFMQVSNGIRMRESWLIKNNPTLYNDIINYVGIDVSFKEKIFLYLNNITEKQKCQVCGGDVKFISITKGYEKNCSIKCGTNNEATKNKRKKTNLEKYGHEHPLKNQEIKDKVKNTNLERYGVTCTVHNKTIKEKIKQNNLEKYGHEHHWSSDVVKDKRKETFLEKYGVQNPFQHDVVKKKIKNTNLTKYGVENPSLSNEIKNRMVVNKIKNKLSNFDRYELLDYKGGVLKLKCGKCNDIFKIDNYLFNQRNRLSYEICVNCFPLNGSNYTKPHREIVEHIKSLKLECSVNDKKILGGKELDVYIPNKKLAIEYNGLYWHSEINKPNDYHLNKSMLCDDLGITLLHIFEDEWMHKEAIVKSIINNSVGIGITKIYARKCEIKEISPKESREFLEKNHIQGNVNARVKLGLFYNNELVSVMTFGKNRKSLGSENIEKEYEMLRFCNKLNIVIVGGASKLFKYFVKKYNPKKITSFSDNRYFNGSLYKKLGFDFISNTIPNYWYFKDFVRYHRYTFRKDKLVKEGFDPNKTERQIMLDRGFNRIYDCGNKKWVWTKY